MPRELRRDRMRKVWVVIRREFVERIRRRWFWVMALLGPLFFAAVFVLPTVLASRGGVHHHDLPDTTAASEDGGEHEHRGEEQRSQERHHPEPPPPDALDELASNHHP